MKVLLACEESQVVCKAMRDLGHEAYSCDMQEPSGGHPEWHVMGDVLPILNGGEFQTMDGETHEVSRWDLIIGFPPCTYLTNASAVRMRKDGEIVPERYANMLKGREFFLAILNADCDRIAVENPVPMRICDLPPYDQIIQPYQFGHPYSKRTCLWLKNLPKLVPTDVVERHEPYVNGGCKDAHGNYRRFQGRNERDPKTRSKTFEGIGRAFAEQFAGDIRGGEIDGITTWR